MSLYVLDTDTLTLLQQGNVAVRQQASKVSPKEMATTVITVEEQLSGWYRILRMAQSRSSLARAYRLLAEQVSLLGRLNVIPFPEIAMARYDELQALRLNIGKMDLRFAAIVLVEAATLVTRNVRDFKRVPGLQIVSWAE